MIDSSASDRHGGYRHAECLVALGLLGLHLYLGRGMSLPIVLGDEFGYLANAAFLTGLDWSALLAGDRYFGFGYSLLLTPFFLLLDEPAAIYRCALIVNAALAAAIVFPARVVLRRIAPDLAEPTRLAIATVAALYPSVLVYSGLAWSETTFVLTFWIAAAVICGLRDPSTTPRTAVLGAFSVAYLYAVNPRGLAVALAAAAVATIAWRSGTWTRRHAIWFLGTLLASLAAVELARRWFIAGLWRGNVAGNDFASIVTSLFGLASPDAAVRWMQLALGQLVYLALSTYGLAIVGLAAATAALLGLAAPIDQSGACDPRVSRLGAVRFRPDAAFLLASLGITFLLGTIQVLAGSRADHWVYGRYNEAVSGPILALGLAALVGRKERAVRLGAFAIVSIACLGIAGRAVGLPDRLNEAQPPVAVTITGLIPYFDQQADVSLEVAWGNALPMTLMIVMACLYRRRIGLGLVAGIFLWAGAYTVNLHTTVARQRSTLGAIGDTVIRLKPNGGAIRWLLTEDGYCNVHRFIYQFLLPRHYVVPTWTIAPRPGKPGPFLVITCGSDLRTDQPSAVPITREATPALTLWRVNPDDRTVSTPQASDPGPALPTSAYQSQIVLDPPTTTTVFARSTVQFERWLTSPRILRSLRGRWRRRVLVVTNTSRLRWPRTVNVGWRWLDRRGEQQVEHRAYFAHALEPGETARLVLPLTPIDARGRVLPAGIYTVRIGLVHEGVTWFHSFGDRTLTLRAEVR